MYDELIERLRYLAKVYSICENENTQEYKLAVEAADAIEKLWELFQSAEKDNAKLTAWYVEKCNKHKWIPVTERLPEDYERVLTCDEHENIHIFPHLRHFNYPFGIRPEDPRFFMPKWWMPLPQPPEMDGE